MKSRFFHLLVMCCCVIFSSTSLFARLHVFGTDSHAIFMDGSSKVNINNNADVSCATFFMVKNPAHVLSTQVYDYASAGDLSCELVISNSNAIVVHEDRLDVLDTTSVYLGNRIDANSNAIVVHEDRLDVLDATSVYLENHIDANSNAIVVHEDRLDVLDATSVYLENHIDANSNAIVVHENRLDVLDATSVYLENRIDANSNAIVALDGGSSNNTDDISVLQARLDHVDTWSITIDHGPGDLDVSVTTTNLVYNLWLSKHHKLNLNTTSGNLIFDGSTHFVHCAREIAEPIGSDPMIIVTGGNQAKLTNVVLKDFSPGYVQLQGGSSVLFGDGTTIEITANDSVSSNYTMSFDGLVRLHCFGNKLDLSRITHALDILSSSTLVIQNACLTGLEGNNLKCLASDSTLTLSNCELILSSNYSFTEGYFNIYQDVVISGTNVFAYQSPQPVTIQQQAQLKVDMGATFSYDSGTTPANARNNRLVMVNDTSHLFFNGSMLHVTTTGLELTKGTLVIGHVVEFADEASDVAGAILFGDDMPSNDLTVEILPGAKIEVSSGYLQYKNSN